MSEYTYIYFDLVLPEEFVPDEIVEHPGWDGGVGAEFEAIASLEKLFGKKIGNEGHSAGALICFMSVSENKVSQIHSIIAENDSTINDGIILVEVEDPDTTFLLTFEALSFQIVDYDDDERYDYEDWEEFYGDRGLKPPW